MTLIFRNVRLLVLAGLTVALAGCGSLFGKAEPTPGDRMIAKGEAVADLGKMWNDGSEMVKRADSLAAEGARLRERGRKNVEDGRVMTERARPVIEEQQGKYARFGTTFGPLMSLEKARAQRKRLDGIIEKWQQAGNDLNKGRELIEMGRSQIADGEAKIAEAERLRRQGHELMRKAEQTYDSGSAVPAGLTQ